MHYLLRVARLGALAAITFGPLGCITNNSDDDKFSLNLSGLLSAINVVQEDDPRAVILPEPLRNSGDTIIINNDVTIITNVQEQIVVKEVPDSLLLGFENITGFDIYIKYLVDDEEQGVLVRDGETLLLDYPCIDRIEMLSEDDIDPDTGVLVHGFDLFSSYEVGFEYECGDALIVTIDPNDVSATSEAVDLLIPN